MYYSFIQEQFHLSLILLTDSGAQNDDTDSQVSNNSLPPVASESIKSDDGILWFDLTDQSSPETDSKAELQRRIDSRRFWEGSRSVKDLL